MRYRITLGGLAALASLLFTAGTANAKGEAGGATAGGSIRDGSPEAVVVLGGSGELVSWSGGSGGGARWTCGYYALTGGRGEGDGPVVDVDRSAPIDPVAGEIYSLACTDETGARVRNGLVRFDPGDPFGGVAAVERAMEQARRQLALPLPEPRLNPPTEQLVGLSTWLWVDGPWQEGSATAAIGAVSATVTARPLRVDWDLGDGAAVTCDAGVRYDPSRPPGEQESSCTHVFTTSTQRLPGGQRTVTATVVYAVEWSASTGAGGELGELSRSVSIPVTVREAQALIR
jgi:hypothetical protein